MNTGPSSHWDVMTLTFPGRTVWQYWKFLDHAGDIFLKQAQGKLNMGYNLLGFLFLNKKEVVWGVKIKNSFGNSGSEMMVLIILREMRNESSRIMTLGIMELTLFCSGICLESSHWRLHQRKNWCTLGPPKPQMEL